MLRRELLTKVEYDSAMVGKVVRELADQLDFFGHRAVVAKEVLGPERMHRLSRQQGRDELSSSRFTR
jgi:hypothetical protein